MRQGNQNGTNYFSDMLVFKYHFLT